MSRICVYTDPTGTVSFHTLSWNGRAGPLRVQAVPDNDQPGAMLYVYRSRDPDTDKDWVDAPHLMNLATCILHAHEFLGVLPPGTVTEDVLT